MNRRWVLAACAGLVALVLVVAIALVVGGGTSSGSPQAAPGKPGVRAGAARPDPHVSALAGQEFYVDPQGHAAQAQTWLRRAGDLKQAAELQRISEQPTAAWFTGQSYPMVQAERLTRAAGAQHRTTVIAIYYLPQRDCGSYSAGGAPSAQSYLTYIRQIAAGLDGRTVAILEPDAIPFAVGGNCAGLRPADRYTLLARAVAILAARPHVRVYLDAGHPAWVQDRSALAAALRASGVQRAAGFALNVSNYQTTAASAAYGEQLSRLLGGKHFVIDTSRNGAGPYPAQGQAAWCNPPGRALGTTPTSDPGIADVDALLWVKQPGDSDGNCAPGQPAAGVWWLQRALELAG